MRRWLFRFFVRPKVRSGLQAQLRGDVPLALAFWGFGVLLGGVCIFVVDLLASDPTAASYGGEHALIVAASICFGHYLLSTVGIWRAASRAIARARTADPEASTVLAYAARCWVVVGIVVPVSGLLREA